MPAGESGVRLKDQSPTFVAPGETIRCLRDHILVRTLPPQWSATLAIEWRGEGLRGEVMAVGPGTWPNVHSRFHKDGKEVRTVRKLKAFRPTEVRVGDIVELGGTEIGGYLWQHVQVDGKDCIICREQDVCGVIDAVQHGS